MLAACCALIQESTSQAASQFWKTDGTGGTWTTASAWGASAAGPFNTTYTANNDVFFTANSTITFATVNIGNLTVSDGFTVTVSQGGTLQTGGTVRTFNIGTGSTLTWTGQTFSTAAGTGFIKTGAGTWDLQGESGAYVGGFTMNAG